ncbi:hypothetical protein QYE76_069880 [Lolium multiflorum]|uniref:X8 domain-containing protein n=1 Tax=Lolium multiflorum TaxID=4521 RepID=A0AAD8SH22_LOLMU|nr:hypothetical protein QYE76_069880 [Lolium multiflorum]
MVEMLKDNNFDRVKLFDADDLTLQALEGSDIQVMVGIPNKMLLDLAGSSKAAVDWVASNISSHMKRKHGVDIRLVAVGDDPFTGADVNTVFPAMQNVQAALEDAGLSNKIKVTVVLGTDVYESVTGKPSDGAFRDDLRGPMVEITRFLAANSAPVILKMQPFIRVYNNPLLPLEYIFFKDSAVPLVDGAVTYHNYFDASHDTLVAALRNSGFPDVPIVVGEVGWPTDGDANATPQNAQQFNQALLKHIGSDQGTPLRPGPVDTYLFSIIDEDQRSVDSGHFERHWGIFYYDGMPKYNLSMRDSSVGLTPAKGVNYLQKRWCILNPADSLAEKKVGESVGYACGLADCTSLGYKTSCGHLDAKGNISYAYNSYYQTNNQDVQACDFNGLANTTDVDPSYGTCKFNIGIGLSSGNSGDGRTIAIVLTALFATLITLCL